MIRLTVLLVAAFLLLHLAGARGHVGLLSGTIVGSPLHALLGVAYVLLWLFTAVIAPIVLLGGLFTALPTVRAASLGPALRGKITAWVQPRRSSRAR